MSELTPTIDWEQLDMIADGYTEDFVEIYRDFETDLPSILSRLESAFSAGDANGVARAAHQAKGSAANFGFVGFSSIMAQIEQSAKSGSLAGILDGLDRGRSAFYESLAALKRERGI